MSEKQTGQPQFPNLGLERVVGFSDEPTPATVEDFRDLKAQFEGIVDQHHLPGRFPQLPGVEVSSFLRQANQRSDSPRFRIITDPYGNLNRGNSYGGNPTISFRIEQGRKSEFEDPRRSKKGSWGAEVTLFEKDGEVLATLMGAIKTGRRSAEPIDGASPNARRVGVEFLDWIKEQIGNPVTLVGAATEVERKQLQRYGRLGLDRILKG
ncbi:MAG TPA: hypothetical protein VHB72_00105 [Candidatus Saccharimonadales bacterium]|jgi:hypothetical protein|nr:hypothetical protein [Candidatus Saccharimonadales bacterium]